MVAPTGAVHQTEHRMSSPRPQQLQGQAADGPLPVQEEGENRAEFRVPAQLRQLGQQFPLPVEAGHEVRQTAAPGPGGPLARQHPDQAPETGHLLRLLLIQPPPMSAPAAEAAVGRQQRPLVRQATPDPVQLPLSPDPLPDPLFRQFFHNVTPFKALLKIYAWNLPTFQKK